MKPVDFTGALSNLLAKGAGSFPYWLWLEVTIFRKAGT